MAKKIVNKAPTLITDLPPDIGVVVFAWPDLPDAIKAGIVSATVAACSYYPVFKDGAYQKIHKPSRARPKQGRPARTRGAGR